MSLRVTRTNIGRYQLVERIGQGGMAVLYLARDPVIDRLVAIKLLQQGNENEELRERFTREARSAGRLRHVNIVTIFDVGEHEGEPFIAMEYIAGETLSQLIRRLAPLSIARRLRLVEELCSGLAYAHSAGVIHRDIKPANAMVDREGTLKVLDFGIARLGDSSMTQSGAIVGTLNYMAPEQLEGAGIDHRCDIFAVGAVMYELLCYRQAFPGSLRDGVIHRMTQSDPPPLTEVVPSLDPELSRIVSRALEKNPDRRYQELVTMRREIAQVRGRLPVDPVAGGAEMPTIAGQPPDTPAPSTRKRADREALARRRAEEIEKLLSDARLALAEGRHQAAVDTCERALLLDPDQSEALVLLERGRQAVDRTQVAEWLTRGREALQAGDLATAVQATERALSIDGTSSEAAAVREAITLVQRNREEEAAEAIAAARDAVSKGQFDEALEHLDRARQKAPTAPGITALYDVATAGRRAQEEARDRTRRLDATLAAADLALKASDLTTAGERVAEALTLDANDGRVLAAQRRLAQAAEEIAAAQRRREEFDGKLADASRLLAAGDLSGALSQADAALALEPGDARAAALRGTIAGRLAEAEAAARRAKEIEAGLAEATTCLETGQLEAARAAIESALRLDPQHGQARQLRSRIVQAINAARAAEERQRRVDTALAQAAASPSHEKAVKLLRQALAIDPANDQVRAALDERQASLDRERAEQQRSREIDRVLATARRASRKKEWDQLDASLSSLAELAPDHPEAPSLRAALADGRAAAQEAEQETAGIRAPSWLQRLSRTQVIVAASVVVATLLLFVTIALVVRGGGQAAPSPAAQATQPDGAKPSDRLAVSKPVGTSATRPAPVPGATASVPARPAPAAPAPEEQKLAELRQQAADQIQRGAPEQALAAIASGLQLRPDDAGLRSLLTDLARDAERRTVRARERARRAGVTVNSSDAFKKGVQAERQARSWAGSGRETEATRLDWYAASLFEQAFPSGQAEAPPRPSTPPQQSAPVPQAAASERPGVSLPPQAQVIPPAPAPIRPAEPTPPAPTPPAPAASAPPAPAPSGAATEANDEAGIRRTLDAYAAAFNSLDVRAVRRVQPSLTSDQAAMLERAFSDYRSYSVTLSDIRITINGAQATATCRVTRRFEPKAGRPGGNTIATTFYLQKAGGAWVIARLSR